MDLRLDCSDVEAAIRKPLAPARLIEPLRNNDFRRWVQAMHYPNRLHYDADFAAEGRFGRLVAPQSFAVVCDNTHGVAPSIVGRIPDSHHLYGGDEWWFYGPRIYDGDMVVNQRVPLEYEIKKTRLAGETCFQRGDNHYFNDRGEKIATQRATSIRYVAEAGRETTAKSQTPAEPEPDWSDEDLAVVEARKFQWTKMLDELGHGKRWWDDVRIGDRLPERVLGPHTIVSFATEHRAFLMNLWEAMGRRPDELSPAALGFAMPGPKVSADMLRLDLELTDSAYYGPARGHLFPQWARYIGMPRAYGYGASMGAWVTDYLAGWAGEWGMVVHSIVQYQGPSLVGDLTIVTGEIIDKMVQDDGRTLVQVECRLTNQHGGRVVSATAEVQLPNRNA
jgi:acyl dehydratase